MPITRTLADIATRAEVALAASLHHPVTYRLGAGGFNPDASLPWDASGRLDCSGFAAFCIGVSRFYKEMPAGDWIETSQIYADATTGRVVFAKLDAPAVGALVVYPDRRAGGITTQGHIGIVAETAADSLGSEIATRVIHCSSGNFRKTGNAIGRTAPTVFDKNAAIYVAPVWTLAPKGSE